MTRARGEVETVGAPILQVGIDRFTQQAFHHLQLVPESKGAEVVLGFRSGSLQFQMAEVSGLFTHVQVLQQIDLGSDTNPQSVTQRFKQITVIADLPWTGDYPR